MSEVTISIVIPTFEEVDNITPLTQALDLALCSYDYELIIVDDQSADGTLACATALSHTYPIRPINRTQTPKSLSHSALLGFQKARGRIVVLMDADLSHPPTSVPALVQPIIEGQADLTMGSRYLHHDKHPWPWYRIALSKGAGLLGRWVCPLSDPTTGFFAIRKSLLDQIPLNPCSWKIALEVATWCQHQRILEVGFIFADRLHGTSKLSMKQAFSFCKHLWQLKQIKPLKPTHEPQSP